MTYAVTLTREALEDLLRLEDFLVESALQHGDFDLPRRAIAATRTEFRILETNPFTCRIADTDRLELRIQPVDATHSLNISAGVRKPSVLRGLSFNCLAIALS